MVLENGEKNLICPSCNNPASWRRFQKYSMWICYQCNYAVTCHNFGKRPVGTMADAETRLMRNEVHKKLDKVWINKEMSRTKMYRLLSEKFGREIHIGEADIEMCKKLLEVVI